MSATPRTGGGGPPARVAVLLSTYNGERYLPEFLTSLDSQSYTHVHLCVRDDGSTDGTVRLLEAHARRRAVSLHRGAHVGVPLSYFHLLRDADDADLFAFSDQDDVWLPHKIERAVRHLERAQPGRAALYCSAVRPVDADLRPIGEPMQPGRGLDFRNALVENRASGCTLVLNRAARALLARAIPRAAQMHDHWAYLVVSAFGSVFHDPLPGLLYRQHHGNEVGVPRGWRSRLAGLRRRGGLARLFSQAEEFRALYGDSLNPTLRRVLDEFLDSRHAGLRQRLAYASRCEVYRQSHLDDLALRGLIAMAYS